MLLLFYYLQFLSLAVFPLGRKTTLSQYKQLPFWTKAVGHCYSKATLPLRPPFTLDCALPAIPLCPYSEGISGLFHPSTYSSFSAMTYHTALTNKRKQALNVQLQNTSSINTYHFPLIHYNQSPSKFSLHYKLIPPPEFLISSPPLWLSTCTFN